ncbi:MAG TPA: SCO family protein [Bryobacteraceae bacterium]|jgi:protein SCO1/2|nr:SCO family protein [Bryobacteraceae bacterium]
MKVVWIFSIVVAAGQSSPPVPSYLDLVGISQKFNAPLPLETEFRDEFGQPLRLGDLFGRRPVILTLVYYTCPGLCDQILHGVASGLSPLALTAGRDFDVIAISINPQESPADGAKKHREIVQFYSRRAFSPGWHFLTGSEASVREVADAVGFRYRYDSASKMYFHPAAIMVATPEGRLARYLYGVEFKPNDLKLALVDASHNRIGSPVEQILLYCYHYDPLKGKYTTTVLNVLRAAAVLFLIVVATSLALLWRFDLKFQRRFREMQRL